MNLGNAFTIQPNKNVVAVVTSGDDPDGQIGERMTWRKLSDKLCFQTDSKIVVIYQVP